MNRNLTTDLKNTIVDLVSDLKENVFTNTDEQGDMMLIEFVFGQMSPDAIMQYGVKHILPHSKQIKDRNIDFFLNNEGIFTGLPVDRINHYRGIITERKRFDEDDEKVVWEYLDTIIGLLNLFRKIK